MKPVFVGTLIGLNYTIKFPRLYLMKFMYMYYSDSLNFLEMIFEGLLNSMI